MQARVQEQRLTRVSQPETLAAECERGCRVSESVNSQSLAPNQLNDPRRHSFSAPHVRLVLHIHRTTASLFLPRVPHTLLSFPVVIIDQRGVRSCRRLGHRSPDPWHDVLVIKAQQEESVLHESER